MITLTAGAGKGGGETLLNKVARGFQARFGLAVAVLPERQGSARVTAVPRPTCASEASRRPGVNASLPP